MRAIDGDHLKRWIISRGLKSQLHPADIIDQIDRESTIEPQRKKGKWLPDNNSLYEMRFVCSECHESEVVPTIGFTKYKPIWDFCPNCGADMREDGEANADVES